MRLLLIETCGATASVAFADTALDNPIRAAAALPGRTASERLVGTIRELAAANNIALQALDAIAVVSGPGSFTGVRVGLSAAKGLCESLGLPLIAISRLAVLTELAPASTPAATFAVLDAGRGEFYVRISEANTPPTESLVSHAQLIAAIKQATAAPPVLIACELLVAESLAPLNPLLVRESLAADALPLALRRVEARDFNDIATADANYLRRTDAEIFAKRAAANVSAS